MRCGKAVVSTGKVRYPVERARTGAGPAEEVPVVESYFAPAVRLTGAELARDIAAVSRSPVVDALLKTVHGLIAVLNRERQILALNEAFLTTIGIDDSGRILGLRLGEAIRCVHAHDMPGGCGTSKYCATCGAAIAIVASIQHGRVEEHKCVATVERSGKPVDICLQVRSAPVEIAGEQFLLLFLQDISNQERRAALEQAFFHDVNNILGGIIGASELLCLKNGERKDELACRIQSMAMRLEREVALQRALAHGDSGHYKAAFETVILSTMMNELQDSVRTHPAARDRRISWDVPSAEVYTDRGLLLRVLNNMVLNALEAGNEDDEVRVDVTLSPEDVFFTVQNPAVIPESEARRIFQRHYSTKPGPGRGMGTYIMKLFGETVLGGTVSFTSSPEDGTTFRFILPR